MEISITPPNGQLDQLSTTDKSLLIDGFCTAYNLGPIPTDICDLITHFNKSIVWTISSSTLQQLTPIKHNGHSIELNRLSGPTFITETNKSKNKLKFQLRMERTTINSTQIQLYLLSDLIRSKIKSITMSVQFLCNELLTEKRQFCLIDNDYNYIEFYPTGTNNNNNNNNNNKILLSNCKQLTISIYVEILSIKYINNYCKQPYIKPIKLNKSNEEITFEWNIDSKMLLKFKDTEAVSTATFWPKNNFGISNNFCVYCIPNMNGCCILFLQLLALPYPLNGIYITYKMEIISDTLHKKYQRINQWLSCQSTLCWNDNPITYQQLIKLKKCKFVITVTIIKHDS